MSEKPTVDLLKSAPLAECRSRATTAEGRALVSALLARVTEYERRNGRKYQRQRAKAAAFLTLLEGFLGDLLLAPYRSDGNPWVHRPLHKKHFVGQPTTHADFTSLRAALVDLGMLEMVQGQQRFVVFDDFKAPGKGWAARFCATPALLEVARQAGIDSPTRHFKPGLPLQVLTLSSKSRWTKAGVRIDGKPMRDWPSQPPPRFVNDVRRLNDFLDGVDITGGVHWGYVRRFNQGNNPDFQWNKGGRLYSVGGGYQLMAETDRLQMRLNGEPVCEIDVRASYLTILCGLTGEPLDVTKDPYGVEGLEPPPVEGVNTLDRSKVLRGVVKTWISATFGTGRPIGQWSPNAAQEYAKATGGRKLARDYRAKALGAKIIEKYPALSRLPDLRLDWSDMMFRESQAILDTMLMLADGGGVPSLAVHDSILVPLCHREATERMLRTNYVEQCGLEPYLTVDQSSLTVAA